MGTTALIGVAVATLALILAACAPAPPRAPSASSPPSLPAWTDPSPHRARFVTVAEGVRLELLDWGGDGPPLIFLSGLGNSAHVFDDFAPAFRDRFHVYGVTRRGFGASSRPETGYDIATLGADVLGVLRELGLKSAAFVGHSIAGEELTWLAAHEPARVEKLVYLDAAYDRVRRPEDAHDAPELPSLSSGPTDADKASIAAFSAFMERAVGVRMPEAEVRATSIFDARGRYVGDRTPDAISKAIDDGVLHPDYARITSPALAIYAVFKDAKSLVSASSWGAMSKADREKLEVWVAHLAQIAARDRDRFRREVTYGRVVELPGAHHYVFLSDRAVVLRETLAFLAP